MVRAGSLPVPAAGQARLRECVCQCACPPGSCPQTLSGLASPFLLQWLWLNTVGSFTKEDEEGDKALATPPATTDCQLGTKAKSIFVQWHFHPLLPPWQQVPLLPFWPGDARKGQCFPWGISWWRREADPTVIPPAPLDPASLESTWLCSKGMGGCRLPNTDT